MKTAREGRLFEKASHWQADPITAFGGFVSSIDFVELGRRPKKLAEPDELKPLSRSSIEAYTSMFAKYVRWMDKQGLTICAVTHEQILSFLDVAMEPVRKGRAKDLNSEIRVRYVRMLERVYQHIGARPNPAGKAAHALFSVPGAAGRDSPKVWLAQDQQDSFVEALHQASAEDDESAKAWRWRRDAAMMALMIGAGLTVTEVIGLYIENIGYPDQDGSVPITVWPTAGSELSRHHTTILRPFAVPFVMSWVAERKTMPLPNELLFPATRKGRRVVPATLYRQVKAAFAEAGIALQREGGRTLRNTFAQREIEAGTSIDRLGEFLGLHDRRSVERYIQASTAVRDRASPHRPSSAEPEQRGEA